MAATKCHAFRVLIIAVLLLGLSSYRSFRLVSTASFQADTLGHEANGPRVQVVGSNGKASSIQSSDGICGSSIPPIYIEPSASWNYIQNAKTIVFLGNTPSFGRFNNQLIQILHALDFIYDRHGEVDTPDNSTAVLAVSRWVEELFMSILGEKWAEIVAKQVPIVRGRGSDSSFRAYARPYHFSSRKIHSYRLKRRGKDPSLDVIVQRRKRLLSLLFGSQCRLVQRLQEHGTTNYVVIHIRSLEGGCFHVTPTSHHRECEMSPDYVRDILQASNASNLPIVVISDMQNATVVENLRMAFGDKVIVPAWDFKAENSSNYTVTDDMMVAAMAQVFVGSRASSMAILIAQLRVIYGHDALSNYVYVRENSTNVCGHCAFVCSKQERADGLCGVNDLLA